MVHIVARPHCMLLALCTIAAGEEGTCPSGQCGSAAAAAVNADQVSLMQLGIRSARQGSAARVWPAEVAADVLNALPETIIGGQELSSDVANGRMVESVDKGMCSELTNNVAYFTVKVGIGTPEQTFNLVADTGSDAVIVPDCKCVQSGNCEALSRCFAAGNSTSFGLDIKKSPDKSKLAIMGAKMNYGSGQIQVVVASEHVRVAHVHAKMHNGVFLMEDRRALKVHGDFEGILGLGLPHNRPLTNTSIEIPAFMDQSSSHKYALCFNEAPKPGALRVGLQALPNPMTNIGTVHWGLDLQGFSVGSAKMPALFCTPDTMKKGMTSACGAIPDSGTTLLMGPPDHVKKLFEEVCNRWPRCQKAAKKFKADKGTAFQTLLYTCESWLEDGGQGIKEIPSIFIHFAGAEGKPQSVELPPWAYVLETTQEVYKVINAKVMGALPLTAAVDTGKKKKICAASFGAQNYTTLKNGPVWIMGAPLFYANSVAYDIGDGKDRKPQIGFEKGPCRMCDDRHSKTTSLVSSGNVRTDFMPEDFTQRPLRRIDAIRESSIDVTGPL